MSLYLQPLLDVHDELIVDLFAGGGGASAGIEQATGRMVDIAINHDAAAVALHAANHPQTLHLTSDVFEVDPAEVCEGRPVGFLWASPDCTFHSKARGGKPIRSQFKKRRALAWVVTRWAGQVGPRVITLENVEEIVNWCPLIAKRCKETGRVIKVDGAVAAKGERVPVEEQQLVPDPRRKGETFRRWVRSLEANGYTVEWRELRACDYGAPTIRNRWFCIARRDGLPIVWPEPTHGDPKTQSVKLKRLKPWRAAAECIDWSIPMLSIFATSEEAKLWAKQFGVGTPIRPLADNTLRRIARGVKRYVLDNPKPFFVNVANSFIAPVMVPRYGEREGQEPRCRSVEEPVPVIVPSGNGSSLVAAHVASIAHGDSGGRREFSANEPLGTQHSGGNKFAVVAAHLNTTNNSRDPIYAADDPANTIVSDGARHNLVASFLGQYNGGFAEGNSGDGHSPADPASTISTKGPHQSVVAANMVKLRGTGIDGAADEPLDTISAGGTHHGLSAAFLDQCNNGFENRVGRSLGEPGGAVCALGSRASLVSAFMSKFYGEGVGQALDEPAHTCTARDRFGLVTVQVGTQTYVVDDIAMRMLQPRELYRAQGFRDSYVIDRGADGRTLTKTEQVRMVGNSVCPPLAEALVVANVPEMIVRGGHKSKGVAA